jgi:hypothetical protein
MFLSRLAAVVGFDASALIGEEEPGMAVDFVAVAGVVTDVVTGTGIVEVDVSVDEDVPERIRSLDFNDGVNDFDPVDVFDGFAGLATAVGFAAVVFAVVFVDEVDSSAVVDFAEIVASFEGNFEVDPGLVMMTFDAEHDTGADPGFNIGSEVEVFAVELLEAIFAFFACVGFAVADEVGVSPDGTAVVAVGPVAVCDCVALDRLMTVVGGFLFMLLRVVLGAGSD